MNQKKNFDEENVNFGEEDFNAEYYKAQKELIRRKYLTIINFEPYTYPA